MSQASDPCVLTVYTTQAAELLAHGVHLDVRDGKLEGNAGRAAGRAVKEITFRSREDAFRTVASVVALTSDLVTRYTKDGKAVEVMEPNGPKLMHFSSQLKRAGIDAKQLEAPKPSWVMTDVEIEVKSDKPLEVIDLG